MVTSLQNALEARRQHIILSRSSINWVKWTVLLVQAGLVLLTYCDGPQRQSRREPHHLGNLRDWDRGRGCADRILQPSVYRGDLCAPYSPAPGNARGWPGGR